MHLIEQILFQFITTTRKKNRNCKHKLEMKNANKARCNTVSQVIFSKKSKASGIECCESENKLSYKEKFTKVPNFIS